VLELIIRFNPKLIIDSGGVQHIRGNNHDLFISQVFSIEEA
jgi:hypothetical protein